MIFEALQFCLNAINSPGTFAVEFMSLFEMIFEALQSNLSYW